MQAWRVLRWFCLSVTLVDCVNKWPNVSPVFYHLVAPSLLFSCIKHLDEITTGSSSPGALNTNCVHKHLRFSTNVGNDMYVSWYVHSYSGTLARNRTWSIKMMSLLISFSDFLNLCQLQKTFPLQIASPTKLITTAASELRFYCCI